MKFPWDDKEDGLARGAERFGSQPPVDPATVEKKRRELRNGITPTEPEPYGLGEGGGSTEQNPVSSTASPERVNDQDECPKCGETAKSGTHADDKSKFHCEACGNDWDADERQNADEKNPGFNDKLTKVDAIQKQILEEMAKDKAGDKEAFGRVRVMQAQAKALLDDLYTTKPLSNTGEYENVGPVMSAIEALGKKLGKTAAQIKQFYDDVQRGVKSQDEWEDGQASKEKKNEDSANLGYQSAQKTTTAQREEYDNAPVEEFGRAWGRLASGVQISIMDMGKIHREVDAAVAAGGDRDAAILAAAEKYRKNSMENSIQSKCLACGHESTERWNGKCGGCGRKNAHDASVGTGRVKLNSEPECSHEYEFNKSCGAKVCSKCGDHKGLDRCFCGWSRGGGNGRQELEEMGETIEEENSKEKKNDDSKKECSRCHGKGGEPGGSEQEPCSACKGDGYLSNALTNGRSGSCDSCTKWSTDLAMTADGSSLCAKCLKQEHGPEKKNTGHLDPITWEAASEAERWGWLAEANLDLALADKGWNELSMDAHQALSNAFDFTRMNSKTRENAPRIPKDFEVQPLKPGENPKGKTTCGECNLSWDDDIVTGMTPAPSARCPFEAFHTYKNETIPTFSDSDTCDTCKARFKPGDTVAIPKSGWAICDACSKKGWAASDTAMRYAKFKNANTDKFGAATATRDDVVTENADKGGDVKEIERHVEGIEHELGELKENADEPKVKDFDECEKCGAKDATAKIAGKDGAKVTVCADCKKDSDEGGADSCENSSSAGVKRGSQKYGSK